MIASEKQNANSGHVSDVKQHGVDMGHVPSSTQCSWYCAVASWFVTLIRMHMHAGSSPEWGTVRTGPLASLLTLSFFVLSRQRLKMRVLGVDVET